MRLEHFKYIVEIARSKSMSKASKKLYITQPALSTAIQNLEEELGFRLFNRLATGVELTDKGAEVLKIAEEVVEQMERIHQLGCEDHENEVGNLKLAAVPVFCNSLMIPLIKSMQREYPHINANVLELRPHKILPALASGVVDLVVGSYSQSTKEEIFQFAAKENIIIEPVLDDDMVCFLNRNHPLARNESISAEELEGDTPAYFNDYVYMSSYEQQQPKVGQNETQKSCYKFSESGSIKKAVSKGIAYAVLPSLMAHDDIYISSGMVIPVPLKNTDVKLTNYIAYSAYGCKTNAMKQTTDMIRKLYKQVEKSREKQRKAEKEECNGENNFLICY